jgi:ABC-type phosphate/phosphonate transport system substrate-binding protein
MQPNFRWTGLAGAIAITLAAAPVAMAADAPDCPNGGVVRFGVEPYDTSAKLVPIYDHIGKALADKIGCQVQIFITTNYNAEIEAMRVGKLEIGEFGPLGMSWRIRSPRQRQSPRSATRRDSPTATGRVSSRGLDPA